MARPYRIQFPGACYHVQIRFSSDARAFRDEKDYARFISMLADAAKKHEVVVYAFCLLKRDAELVVQTPRANLSLFLQGLQTGYARYHHQKYRFEGPLVRDRFRSKVVEAPRCLLPPPPPIDGGKIGPTFFSQMCLCPPPPPPPPYGGKRIPVPSQPDSPILRAYQFILLET